MTHALKNLSKTRTIPSAIRRALKRRDGGCRFPGCTCMRFVDTHHIRHWADGGDTSMDNPALLRHHHRLVHEDGFSVAMGVGGQVRFTKPDGQVMPDSGDKHSRGNVIALYTAHAESGIHITPETTITKWCGESMDDQLAVEGLLYSKSPGPVRLELVGFKAARDRVSSWLGTLRAKKGQRTNSCGNGSPTLINAN